MLHGLIISGRELGVACRSIPLGMLGVYKCITGQVHHKCSCIQVAIVLVLCLPCLPTSRAPLRASASRPLVPPEHKYP